MDSWVFIALIAPLTWTVATIFDKILTSRFVSDGITAGILTNIFSGFLILILLPIFPHSQLAPGLAGLFLLAGVVWGWNRICFVKGISMEEASRVVTIVQINPVLILIGSAILFKEIIGYIDLIAFAMILAGVLWISIKKVENSFQFSPATKWLVLNAFIFTATTLLLKKISIPDWWTALFWINLGFAAGSIPFLFLGNNFVRARTAFEKQPLKLFGVLLIINIFTLAGRAGYFAALGIAPAAIVAVIASTNALFVFIASILLSFIVPTLLNEEHSFASVLNKLGAIILIIVGIAILSLI